ncbi:uncharacterized protein LOC129976188 isoform X2 [Argiope bruennichi]|uniref:uncharacterized protein LOC129976188 isoform X2 n=1 Tax=Argiope bruennichi TaxID=94029 RepID=UPI002494AC94|nr:uncharacterized protein LOC129976188 isoform X2 [Argiope bruennichi]
MDSKSIVYFQDLPFQLRRELCDILDTDRRWEELGRIHMSTDMTAFMRQAALQNKSPTWELLNKYSEREGTVKQLFTMLEKMDHERAMTVLKPYVDEKYQCFLKTDHIASTTISSSLKNANDMFRPASTEFPVTTSCSSLSTSAQGHLSGAEGLPGKQKETFSTSSKLNHDCLNLNIEFSKTFFNSKMNDFNISQSHSRGVDIKKSPKYSNFETNASSYEESGLTKCVSEKMKDTLNLSSLEDCLQDIKQISYGDICKATDYFSKERFIGRGGFGTVHRGEWKGTYVAVKKFIPRDEAAQQLESIKRFLKELNTVKMRYDYILPLYAVSSDGKNLCLIYQFMVNGSLEDRLLLKNKTPPLTWSQRSHIAECIAKGLNYLHTAFQKPLIHGNIKSSNILLDANMNAKIGEFGLTKEGPGCQVSQHKCLSPELDIYSYGIVLLEIGTGLRPFDAKRGKGIYLCDHVQLFANSGQLESLQDTKAGEENMIWGLELLKMGQICSNVERKKRPPFSQILLQFEKIKQEIFMFDGIQWPSNDKNSSSLPTNLPAFELQWYDDPQKSTQSEMLPNDKNFSLETSGDPGYSAGVSGISVPHKELSMDSSSAQAEVSLETSREPGCSPGVSGISVPHKEPSMASSSAQADVSLETFRYPGCSAGISGISVPYKEPPMASSSAQADVLSCESLSSGEVDRALGSCPLDSEPEKKEAETSFGGNSPSICLQFCDNRCLQLNLPMNPISNNLQLSPTSVRQIVEEYECYSR